ncbi:MAG TPA: cytochrome P450, partial [Allocoleopsis sp.]
MQTLTGPTTPSWLQKIQWAVNPIGYMDEAGQTYGDLFYARIIGNQPSLFVSHPQALQQIFSNDTKQFSAPANKLIQPVVGSKSIFAMEGDRHIQERKLLMPPFHGERMRAYGQLICDLTTKLLDPIQPGEQFVARTVLQDVSMEVILRAVFGLSEGERYYQLRQLIIELTNAFQVPYIGGLLYFPRLQQDWTPWRVVRRLKQGIDELLFAEIRDRRQAAPEERADILSLLLSTRSETGEGLSDEELRDQLITLLLAGHETTSNAITWALYWIHRHLEVRDKLRLELDQLKLDQLKTEGAIDPTTLFRLPDLTAVCNESLRLYPVAMLTVPRATREPVELMGHALPAGTRIYGCIYLTHHRE